MPPISFIAIMVFLTLSLFQEKKEITNEECFLKELDSALNNLVSFQISSLLDFLCSRSFLISLLFSLKALSKPRGDVDPVQVSIPSSLP
jgi:hypothetical protein